MNGVPDEMVAVDKVRATIRRALQMFIERGVPVEDVAIGALYACFDTAELLPYAGPEQAAVEWMRTGCDMLERSIVNGVGRTAT